MRGGRFALMMRRPALPRFGADDVPIEKPPPAGAGGAWALNAKPGVAGCCAGAAPKAGVAPKAGAAGAPPKGVAAGAPPPNGVAAAPPPNGVGCGDAR